MNDRGAISPAIADPAANTNIAASRRTTDRRLPTGPKPQQKGLLDRLRRPRRRPHEHQGPRHTSRGRRPRLVASFRERGRHARSVAAERGHPAESAGVQSPRVADICGLHHRVGCLDRPNENIYWDCRTSRQPSLYSSCESTISMSAMRKVPVSRARRLVQVAMIRFSSRRCRQTP